MSSHQLTFSFRKVEGQTVNFTNHGDDVDQEAGQQAHTPPQVGLCGHNPGGGHGARNQEHGHNGQTHGQLVADHLGGATHCTKQRVGGVGRPTT